MSTYQTFDTDMHVERLIANTMVQQITSTGIKIFIFIPTNTRVPTSRNKPCDASVLQNGDHEIKE